MNILLDTHALIWFFQGSEQLSKKARELIENPQNNRFVSIASLWEIAIKISIGKFKLHTSYDKLAALLWENDIDILPIRFEHTNELLSMPFHHKDPFDRLIIAQAVVEKMPVISRDGNFSYYNAEIFW